MLSPSDESEMAVAPAQAIRTTDTPALPAALRANVRTPGWVWWVVALLCAGYAALAVTASWRKGVSFDEGVQLAMGYNIWVHQDFRLEGANGDFVKRWATLPYLWSKPNFVTRDDPRWRQLDSYAMGRTFLFDLGNKPEELLREARAMMVPLGVAICLLVFFAARSIFGWVGGLVALLGAALSPHLLAFGGIVSTDLPVTLALFGSTLAIWRLLHRVTPGRVAASLGLFALLVLAKLTALVILPVTAVLLVVREMADRPLEVVGWRRAWRVTLRRRRAGIWAALIGLHALAGLGAIWAHYGFRFESDPRRHESSSAVAAARYWDKHPGPSAAVVRWVRAHRVLPDAFCTGVNWLLGSDDNMLGFMAGRITVGGWAAFFPYTIWVKTQPMVFLLLLFGAGAIAGRRWLSRREPSAGGATWRGQLYGATPHLALIAVYLAVAASEDINIGHRHVLPVYPSLYVLTGSVAALLVGGGLAARLGIGALLLWRGVDTAGNHPHYLAYFGPQAGGADEGYTHLIDSSVDWGMDLPGLKRWLLRHDPEGREPLFLAYFGTDSPGYHGIRATRLPGFHPARDQEPYAYRPGYYAISATLLQGAYLPTFGSWNDTYERVYQAKLRSVLLMEETDGDPARMARLLQGLPPDFWPREFRTYDYFRFGRLCAWLRQHGRTPHQVGHSILVWKLGMHDLQAALNGPPPERGDVPEEWLEAIGLDPAEDVETYQIVLAPGGHSIRELSAAPARGESKRKAGGPVH